METPSEVITFDYDCSEREFREGKAITANPPSKNKGKIAKPPFGGDINGLIGWITFIAAVVLLGIYLKQTGSPQRSTGTSRLLEVLPSSTVLALSETGAFAGAGLIAIGLDLNSRAARRPQRRWKGKLRMSIGPDGFVEMRPGVTTRPGGSVFAGLTRPPNFWLF